MQKQSGLTQLNVIVKDMAAALAFYRRLGLTIEAAADAPHAEATLSNGIRLEFDTASSVRLWDSGWDGTTGSGLILGFAVESRDRVDEFYGDLTRAGYRGHQPPYDAFWGARYAVVEDPDGNGVGLMSPIEKDRKFWPPSTPPSA